VLELLNLIINLLLHSNLSDRSALPDPVASTPGTLTRTPSQLEADMVAEVVPMWALQCATAKKLEC